MRKAGAISQEMFCVSCCSATWGLLLVAVFAALHSGCDRLSSSYSLKRQTLFLEDSQTSPVFYLHSSFLPKSILLSLEYEYD